MKLYITNLTWWRSDDVRRLVIAGLKAEGMWTPRGSYMVRITYSKGGGGIGGYGYYHRNDLSLALPKQIFTMDGPKVMDELPRTLVERAAQVLVHEVGHNQGLLHKEMVHSGDIAVPWAEGLVIRRKGAEKKDKPSTVELREAHVDGKVAEIEGKLIQLKTREKRLRTKLREWKKKQRYYMKKAAARKGT